MGLIIRLTGHHRVQISGEQREITLGLFYALDMLLLIIRLREAHYEGLSQVAGQVDVRTKSLDIR